jgi:hypothetical protein
MNEIALESALPLPWRSEDICAPYPEVSGSLNQSCERMVLDHETAAMRSTKGQCYSGCRKNCSYSDVR